MKTVKYPLSIKHGSVAVKIYRTPSNGCEQFTLSYYQDGVRRRPTFSNLDAAKREANLVAIRLGNTDGDVLTLSSADRSAYLRACQLLAATGIPIETAVAEYVQLKKILGEVSPLLAAEYYVKRNPVQFRLRSVRSVADEMLKIKESDGLSDEYLRHLRYDLNKFTAAFNVDIGNVLGTEVDRWLRGLEVSPRTRNNLRASVQTLFAFAKAQKYLPKDHDEIDSVMVAKGETAEIEIFTPKEMAEIFAHALPKLIPFLALGAFAGIRHAEIGRLEWADIQFDGNIIEIKASKAKTASRRTIPILENLRAWLLPHRQEAGLVCGALDARNELESLVQRINEARRAVWAGTKGVGEDQLLEAKKQARQAFLEARAKSRASKGLTIPPGAETARIEGWAPFVWKHNALRHSFISYRVAETQNVAQVSLEAGNSPQMIFKHYRELVRPTAAKDWFAITPK